MKKSKRALNVTNQMGGALIETLVLCLVLLPLLFSLPAIGNLIDLKQTTILASRFVAWEETVTTERQNESKVKAFFYDSPNTAIQSGISLSAVKPAANSSGLWRVLSPNEDQATAFDKNQLLASFADGGGYFTDTDIEQSGLAYAVGESVKKLGGALEFLDSVQWDIEGDGMVDAGVQVNAVSNTLGNADGIACNGKKVPKVIGCVSAHTSILVDGWGVADNTAAENRTRALVPGTVLRKVGGSLSKLGRIPTFKELSGLEHSFGYVDSTQLPLDRYIGTYQRAD